MILFYSEYCQHCKVLLETIKRHDKSGMIKLVSIDLLRSLQKPIDPKIHSVPALLINKEYLFGKAVFDHLLLPNRGVLFSGQTTRQDKTMKNVNDMGQPVNDVNNGDPQAFALGAISAEYFSNIDDSDSIISDKNYSWDKIDNVPTTITTPEETNKVVMTSGPMNSFDNKKSSDDDNKKRLPSMEEIMKQRANDIL